MDEITELERVAKRLEALRVRRDELIVASSSKGHSLRTVAKAAGLSHAGIAKALRRQS